MARNLVSSMLLLLLAAGSAAGQDTPFRPGEVWALKRLDLEIEIDGRHRLRVSGNALVVLEEEESAGPSMALNSRARALRYRSAHLDDLQPGMFFYPPPDGPTEVAQFTRSRMFRRGDTAEVRFEAEAETGSMQLYVGADGAFASWVEQWYPVPAAKKDGLASPAAPGRTTFRIPASWRSVSNGVLQSSVVREGVREETWILETPAARSFAAGPYIVEEVESGGRSIRFFQLKSRAGSRRQAEVLAQSIDAMEKRFGPYPYAQYSVAEVPREAAKGNFAASSEQGFIMVREDVLDDAEGTVPLFAHEAAHGWWGNLVRTDGPGEQVVSESLAQYGAVIAIDAMEGRAAAAEFLRFSRSGYNPLQCALGYFHIWRDLNADKPLSRLGDDKWDHNLSDSKGHWFHHMLRLRVGDERFFTTLRSLIARWKDDQLTLDAYRQAFLKAIPDDAGLSAFLSQWLDRTGAPVLDVDWWSIDRGKGIEIDVVQLQEGPAFELSLEVDVTLADGSRARHVLSIDEMREKFTFPVSARPMGVIIDPDDRLLLWRPEYGPRPPARAASVQ